LGRVFRSIFQTDGFAIYRRRAWFGEHRAKNNTGKTSGTWGQKLWFCGWSICRARDDQKVGAGIGWGSERDSSIGTGQARWATEVEVCQKRVPLKLRMKAGSPILKHRLAIVYYGEKE